MRKEACIRLCWDNPEGPYWHPFHSLAELHGCVIQRLCIMIHIMHMTQDLCVRNWIGFPSRLKNLIVHVSKKVGKVSDMWPIVKSFWDNMSPSAEDTHKRPSKQMQCVSMTTGSQYSPLTTAPVCLLVFSSLWEPQMSQKWQKLMKRFQLQLRCLSNGQSVLNLSRGNPKEFGFS